MARDKAAKGKGSRDRDLGPFLALPIKVIESEAYRSLSHTARSLLIDVCSKGLIGKNGHLVATAAYLKPLGWNSEGTMRRALKELLDSGLLVMTRLGGRKRCAWYGATWHNLPDARGLDIDGSKWDTAHRGLYLRGNAQARNKRDAKRAPSQGAQTAEGGDQQSGKACSLSGSEGGVLCSLQGSKTAKPALSDGAIEGGAGTFFTPSEGDLLERSHKPAVQRASRMPCLMSQLVRQRINAVQHLRLRRPPAVAAGVA